MQETGKIGDSMNLHCYEVNENLKRLLAIRHLLSFIYVVQPNTAKPFGIWNHHEAGFTFLFLLVSFKNGLHCQMHFISPCRSVEWKCDQCGHVRNLLRPVTEASEALNKEAKELGAKIKLQACITHVHPTNFSYRQCVARVGQKNQAVQSIT